jgi:hypothetical protein
LDADERFAESFECAGRACGAETTALFGRTIAVGVGETREISADRGEKHVAQSGDERFTKNSGISATRQRVFDGDQCTTGVAFAKCFDEFVDGIFGFGNAAGSNNAIKSGKCVACRTCTDA